MQGTFAPHLFFCVDPESVGQLAFEFIFADRMIGDALLQELTGWLDLAKEPIVLSFPALGMRAT